jgi:hypothetical protein
VGYFFREVKNGFVPYIKKKWSGSYWECSNIGCRLCQKPPQPIFHGNFFEDFHKTEHVYYHVDHVLIPSCAVLVSHIKSLFILTTQLHLQRVLILPVYSTSNFGPIL